MTAAAIFDITPIVVLIGGFSGYYGSEPWGSKEVETSPLKVSVKS